METSNVTLRRLKTFLKSLENKFALKNHTHATSDITGLDTALSSKATSAQGSKADTAVQSVKIGTTEYKSGTTVTLPSYPTSLPASDVSAWAKASSKPSYTKSEVGLSNVDNTADSAKSVKYATSAGSANSASKATGVVDYRGTDKTIQIGYSGDGISGNDIKYIAGYTTGNGSDVDAKIKDVSKDALKSWLGLGSLAYSSATIPTTPSSLPANGGTATYANYVYATSHQGSWYQNSQWDGTYFQTNYKYGDSVLPMKVGYSGYSDNSGKVNNHTVNSDVPANAKFTDTTYPDATTSAHGLMSPADKTKLDKIGSNVSIGSQITIASGTSISGVANNLTTTGANFVLDARQGKALNNKLESNMRVEEISSLSNVYSGYTDSNIYYVPGSKMMFVNFRITSVSAATASDEYIMFKITEHLPANNSNAFSVSAWDMATGNICLSYGRVYNDGSIRLYLPKGIQVAAFANFHYLCKN